MHHQLDPGKLKHLNREKLEKGKNVWNRWRNEYPDNQPDLSRYDLHKLKTLEGYNLKSVDFTNTNLSWLNLDFADLTGARLINTNIHGTRLNNTIFKNALMGGTILTNISLNNVDGLEFVKHASSSSLGIDTILRSQGEIPFQFLQGCGIPDIFLSEINSLLGKKRSFQSVLISYSSTDEEFARHLYNRLFSRGVDCWLAGLNLLGGEETYRVISEEIEKRDRVILIISQESMKSRYVTQELSMAFKKEEKTAKEVILPLRLCTMSEINNWEDMNPNLFNADLCFNMAEKLRARNIQDYSNWQERTFMENLTKTLDAMRVEKQD